MLLQNAKYDSIKLQKTMPVKYFDWRILLSNQQLPNHHHGSFKLPNYFTACASEDREYSGPLFYQQTAIKQEWAFKWAGRNVSDC